jgi:hypothetical protein
MKSIKETQRQLSTGDFDFTRHGFKRAIERDISENEIREAGKDSKIIESYPDDKYTASCLLLGFTSAGRPLHLQVSLADSTVVKIITVYEPDEKEWIDYYQRR